MLRALLLRFFSFEFEVIFRRNISDLVFKIQQKKLYFAFDEAALT